MPSQPRITLVSEEQDFIVIDKPNGVPMRDSAVSGIDSLIHGQFDDDSLFPVHRLDKETSGLLIVSKGKKALSALSLAFQNKQVDKYYWAISSNKPKKKQGTVDGGMAKSRDGCWKLTRSHENRAVTQFFSFGLGRGQRAFLVKPYTGKTHQIRVALKSLGSPLMGDQRYGGCDADRMYLHATQLRFAHGGQVFSFDSHPHVGELFQSTEFKSLLGRVSSYSELSWPGLSINLERAGKTFDNN